MAVFAIYVVYYAANILYDAFLKQSKTNTGEEEEIISIGEEEEIPLSVCMNYKGVLSIFRHFKKSFPF